jgi:hypothetical protein
MADIITTPIVTPDVTSTDTVARVPVGTVVTGTYGSRLMYVIAQSAIAQYDCVAILNSSSAQSSLCASPITTTFAALSPIVGFAQTAIAAGSYGWVHLSGSNIRVNVLIAAQPAVGLFTTSTGGSLDDATVSAGYLAGVVGMTSAASASAIPIYATAGAQIEALG